MQVTGYLPVIIIHSMSYYDTSVKSTLFFVKLACKKNNGLYGAQNMKK